MDAWIETFEHSYNLKNVCEISFNDVIAEGFIPDKDYYLYFSAKNNKKDDMILALLDCGGYGYDRIEIYDLMSPCQKCIGIEWA